jgi:2-iminobutanoate/2-iminopropanoate deaminase
MKKIETTLAPAAIGPYSQAIVHGDLLFVSGQLPIDPASGALVGETAAEQIAQCLANVRSIAQAAGANIDKTVKTTVLLTDLGEFSAVNETYGAFFKDPFPARACYQVAALPKGARVEVEAIIAME